MRSRHKLWVGPIVLLFGCTAEPSLDTAGADESGEQIFDRVCAVCHGVDGRGGTQGPDLLDVARDMDANDLTEVILYGSGYMDPLRLTEDQALTVSTYIVDAYLAQSP